MKPKVSVNIADSRRITELIRDVHLLESVLEKLDHYLEKGNPDFTIERRELHVKFVIEELVREGEVRYNSRAHRQMDAFYQKRFGAPLPYYNGDRDLHTTE